MAGTFDALLVERAVQLGAQLHARCRALEPVVRDGRVVGRPGTSLGELRSGHVVDAAGGGHWIGQRLGLELDRGSPPLIARFGYVTGVCPQRDGAPAIVGTGEGWTWTARVGEGLYAWTRLGLAGCAPVRRSSAGARRPAPRPPAQRRRQLAGAASAAGPGYVAAGDAAAVLDPASSHGVLRALLSGMHAARPLLAVRAGDDEAVLAASYNDFLAAWFEHDANALRELYMRLPGRRRGSASRLAGAAAGGRS